MDNLKVNELMKKNPAVSNHDLNVFTPSSHIQYGILKIKMTARTFSRVEKLFLFRYVSFFYYGSLMDIVPFFTRCIPSALKSVF